MKLLLGLMLLLPLVACDNRSINEYREDKVQRQVELAARKEIKRVTEIELEDGTRCVYMQVWGGLSCNWGGVH